MKTILVHIAGDEGQSGRLQAGLSIARSMSGHISLCQPAPPPIVMGGVHSAGVWTSASFEDIEEKSRAYRAQTQQQVEAVLGHEDVPWDWRDTTGFSQEAFVAQTALADLSVVSLLDGEKTYENDDAFLNHVVTHAATPVLAMPTSSSGIDPFAPVLIAWDGSLEAAKAVRGALPLLAQASEILAISVGTIFAPRPGLSDLGSFLARHGLKVKTDEVAEDGQISAKILSTAQQIGAGCVVMGAYGHPRLLEMILGGETRRMLKQGQTPVLFAH